MEALPFAELGVSGVAIATIFWIVRAFLQHLTVKDEKFTAVVGNHIDHSTRANIKLARSIDHNIKTNQELKESHEKMTRVLDDKLK